MSVAAPVLIRNYHWSPATVGMLLSVFNWAYTFTMLGLAPLSIGCGRVLPTHWQCLSGPWRRFCVERPFALSHLAVFRGLVGVGEGPMLGSGISVIHETFPKEQRATAVGYLLFRQ